MPAERINLLQFRIRFLEHLKLDVAVRGAQTLVGQGFRVALRITRHDSRTFTQFKTPARTTLAEIVGNDFPGTSRNVCYIGAGRKVSNKAWPSLHGPL